MIFELLQQKWCRIIYKFHQNTIFGQILRFWVKITWFLSFSSKNHAESSRNLIKNSVLDPKWAKFNRKSWFGHVRTCQDLSRRTSTYCKPAEILLFFQILHLSILLVFSWLHKLRNTQGEIHGTYLGNIYIYIYMWNI